MPKTLVLWKGHSQRAPRWGAALRGAWRRALEVCDEHAKAEQKAMLAEAGRRYRAEMRALYFASRLPDENADEGC